ncbi:MAG: LPS export ABC transporter permease LptG [Pseudomonadota bacterium]
MTILDRYITIEFLKVFALCVVGFILVFLLVEITDKIKYYFRHDPSGSVMLKYFLVKIPGYLVFVMPLGILLGGMLSLFMMARNSEIIAMQANGIDALAIARPVLTIGLTASLLMLAANETVIPWSNRYSEEIQDKEIIKKPENTFFRHDRIWVRSPTSITHIGKFVKLESVLERITIVAWDEDYRFQERIYAEKARWWADHWVFYGVNRTVRMPNGRFTVETLPSMKGRLNKSPQEFDRVERPAKEMNLFQLSDYIDKIEEEGQHPTRYLVDWHDKTAFPFVCLIMAALSVPFAVKADPRRGGFALGLAVSVAIAFSYWIVHTMFIALGHGGFVPPFLAAWAANALFGLSAAILMLQAGT